MQDTFYIRERVISSQNSPSSVIEFMEKNLQKVEKKPPFAIIAQGKCFRNEATDATHNTVYQIEGHL